MNLKDKLICFTSAILIGFLTCLCLISAITQKSSFWDFRFIDILRLLVIILIAVFITHYIALKNNKKTKTKELYDKFLNIIYNDLLTMENDILYFMKFPEKSNTKEIALHFKSITIKLMQLKTNIEDKIIKEKICKIEDSISKIQDIVQDDTWGIDKIEYSIDYRDNVKKEFSTSINFLVESIFLNYK